MAAMLHPQSLPTDWSIISHLLVFPGLSWLPRHLLHLVEVVELLSAKGYIILLPRLPSSVELLLLGSTAFRTASTNCNGRSLEA